MTARILVLGGSGYFGRNLVNEFRKLGYELVLTYNQHPVEIEGCKSFQLDITRREDVSKLIHKEKPIYVVNSIVWRPAKCDSNPYACYDVNASGTEVVARECSNIGSKLILPSSSYVFDGKKGNYKEDDKRDPLNLYGKTKVIQEEIVRYFMPESHVIIRLGWLYGGVGEHGFTFVFEALKQGKPISISNELYGNPTNILHVLKALHLLLEKDFAGTLHLADLTKITRYEFIRKVAEIVFSIDPSIVKCEEIGAEFSKGRPHDSSLNTEEGREILGEKYQKCFTTLTDSLFEMKMET